MFLLRWYREKKKKKRLEEVRKNPYKRVDSDKMTDIEKMNKGFNGKTYTVNGLDVDFLRAVQLKVNYTGLPKLVRKDYSLLLVVLL